MTRKAYIDIAKALCIILVVLGHFNPSCTPPSGFWEHLIKGIYAFHMPTFMFLSGLLYSMTVHPEENYLTFMARKLKRLYVPYLSASIIIISIKLVTQSFMPVKNTVTPTAFLELFFYPSAAVHLWFCFTLLWTFAIVRIAGNKQVLLYFLLTGSALLWFLPVRFPGLFCLDHLPKNLVFFVLGCIFGQNSGFFSGLPKFAGLFVVFVFVCAELLYSDVCPKNGLLSAATAVLGIASVLVVAKILEKTKLSGSLVFLGECSFFIYLFHTTFMEFVKAVLPKAGLPLQENFFTTLVITVIAGIAGPVIVQKCLVEKSKALSFAFGVRRRRVVL